MEKQVRQIFKPLLGVTATICSSAAAQLNMYVAFEFDALARPRFVDLRTSDRFTVADGPITSRSVYFAPTVLLRVLARHPSWWPAALTSS